MRFSPNILLGLVLVGCGDKDTETNGLVDADGDGFTSEFDCDDKDETINPSAEEICDGLDNNCDGVVDGDELAPNLCPEDVNSDGFISVADVLQVLGEFGCSTSCDNDVDGDGAVTVADILTILSAFGSSC